MSTRTGFEDEYSFHGLEFEYSEPYVPYSFQIEFEEYSDPYVPYECTYVL